MTQTNFTPNAHDRVQYNRGKVKHLIGHYGVVVPDENRQTLPSGLRYVLFDGERSPKVVAADGLDQA
ncbi:hypothetical protein [Curtobacterium sp. VKM Ac-1395]|jgi:hypothetical protein|uniref:hypothetical protein n=1 Tax=Curtobacterium sp. VKM Ac-1395 TaxID=2783815 RepID=UPI00188D0472|nr:hypothetical protein [Curtobacterium sp. VKM Ac-1395]MBF4591699.1 hypothetical protein [Curtobacterium sp. VKM Ac-1395]